MAPSDTKLKKFSHKTKVFTLQNNSRNLNLDFRMLWKRGGGMSHSNIAVHLSDLDWGGGGGGGGGLVAIWQWKIPCIAKL